MAHQWVAVVLAQWVLQWDPWAPWAVVEDGLRHPNRWPVSTTMMTTAMTTSIPWAVEEVQ